MDTVGRTFTQVHRDFSSQPSDWGADKHIRGEALGTGTRLYNHSSFSISGFGEKAASDRQTKWDTGASAIKDSIDQEFGDGMGDRVFAKVGQDTGRNLDHGVTRADVGRLGAALREEIGGPMPFDPPPEVRTGRGGRDGTPPLKANMTPNQTRQAEIFGVPRGSAPGTVEIGPLTRQALTDMFGKNLSDTEIRGLCGLPETASIRAEMMESNSPEFIRPDRGTKYAVTIGMTVGDTQGAFKETRITLYKTESGGVNLFRDKSKLNYELKDESRPPGNMGGAMLVKQVNAAKSLGIQTIHNYSAGGKGYNGFYTWPRYGANAPLTGEIRSKTMEPKRYDEFRAALSQRFPQLANKPDLTLQDLMATQQGRDFWRENGFGLQATFDLTPGSQTMRAFESYTIPNSCFDLA
jgi:hypothetical protein